MKNKNNFAPTYYRKQKFNSFTGSRVRFYKTNCVEEILLIALKYVL